MEAAEQTVAMPARRWSALAGLARPHQWIKNGVVLAALIFGHRLFSARDVARSALALIAFCAISSAGYIINDWMDRDADLHHPEKRMRPLASRTVDAADALWFAAALAAFGLGAGALLGADFVAVATSYLALQWI